jgi:acyl-CoA thioesterase II
VTQMKIPQMLELERVGDHRYRVFLPEGSPEGRDVVFGGQLLAQMLMASDTEAGGAKDVKSIHAIFARSGSYSAPIELQIDPMQSGRTWASDAITAWQGDRLLSRSLVLMSIDDPDFMRHEIEMPDVPGPDGFEPTTGLTFPDSEIRKITPTSTVGGVPTMYFWHRFPGSHDSPAVNQAILAWETNGFFIELAMQPHADKVSIGDAHRSVSTGVIGHTINFHERFDIGQWLLLAHEATYAGRGRVHGRGMVFTEDGRLVATFTQDSMVRGVEGPLDPTRAM